MTSAISFPASTSEANEGTAKSGVPINTIRIKNVSPQPKPRRLQITAESQVPSPSAITIQQEQIYPKPKKEPHKSSSLSTKTISEDAPPWSEGTRANRARTTQSPVLSAHISSRAQFRSEARMFELRLLLHAQFRTSRRALNGLFVRAGLFEHGAKPKPCGGRGRRDLLRLARSSAAGQGVLVLLDCLEPLHGLESLEHGVAVQVIDLVL
mgnify:CR=1 FL=1